MDVKEMPVAHYYDPIPLAGNPATTAPPDLFIQNTGLSSLPDNSMSSSVLPRQLISSPQDDHWLLLVVVIAVIIIFAASAVILLFLLDRLARRRLLASEQGDMWLVYTLARRNNLVGRHLFEARRKGESGRLSVFWFPLRSGGRGVLTPEVLTGPEGLSLGLWLTSPKGDKSKKHTSLLLFAKRLNSDPLKQLRQLEHLVREPLIGHIIVRVSAGLQRVLRYDDLKSVPRGEWLSFLFPIGLRTSEGGRRSGQRSVGRIEPAQTPESYMGDLGWAPTKDPRRTAPE